MGTYSVQALLLLFAISACLGQSLLGVVLGSSAQTPTTPEFRRSNKVSVKDAKYYAKYSAAVYCTQPLLSNWTCVHCLKLGKNVKFLGVVRDAVFNTQAIVTKDSTKQEIVATFRGTTNVRNVVVDYMGVLITTEYSQLVKVHAGAWLAMKSLYDGVTGILKPILDTNRHYKIVIVGHSLGGMEASLFAFAFRNSPKFRNLSFTLYTYGAPRAGDIEFAHWMNRQMKVKVARVVNQADLAPAAAVTPSSLGFVHFHTEMWIQKSGKVKICSTEFMEDPTCSNSNSILPSFQDHLKYWDTDYMACVPPDPFGNLVGLI